ncbi:MAG: methionine gamma-lyase family protein [Clostridiales bacterium]|nr:methionine gamma-lyase family protein [Clostridiales bacterium]
MSFFKFDSEIEKMSETALKKVKPVFEKIDEITEYNQQKVLSSFRNNNVSESCLGETTGYGYGDKGRDALESTFAEAVGAESALVRHTLTCGTHTLTVALFGLLRPGDIMLSATGTPYDTILPTIGTAGEGGRGSLIDFGVKYKETALREDGSPDVDALIKALKKEKIKLVYIQRSRGYSLRPSLSVKKIDEIVRAVRENSDAVVMVDNCYGEFVEKEEPTDVGADIIAGSLIKNPGGGIAKNGGYIAGKKKLVELCSYRMTTPGLGAEVGASLGHTREMFMGLFNAPHVTGEALKTAAYTAALFEEMGFVSSPRFDEDRHDIIEAIKLKNSENLIAFCRGLQSGAPVDSFVVPEPWDMPGYDSKVIMAAGTFTLGSSIELSGDAPLREPFAVWMQGGLNFHSAKVAVNFAAEAVKIQNSK